MKKILFLLLILCIIKINAYEYIVWHRQNAVDMQQKYILMTNDYGELILNSVRVNGNNEVYNVFNDPQVISILGNIKSINNDHDYGYGSYIDMSRFNSYYKNDELFLNDMFIRNDYYLNAILNYFYNNNNFNSTNYIRYENYELLYNINGLAVESLVDGVYAGLYNMDEMQFSGNLYNENGDLVLVNGVEPSFFQVLCDKLIGDLHLKMLDAENLIDKGWIFAVAFTLAIFYLIARTLKRVLIGKKSKGVENES